MQYATGRSTVCGMSFIFPGRSRLLPLVLAVVAVPLSAFAQSLDVDWKYFGGAEPDGKTMRMFYDAKSIVRSPDGHIQVWTKGLLESEIDRILKKTDKARIERVAQKVAAYYLSL